MRRAPAGLRQLLPGGRGRGRDEDQEEEQHLTLHEAVSSTQQQEEENTLPAPPPQEIVIDHKPSPSDIHVAAPAQGAGARRHRDFPSDLDSDGDEEDVTEADEDEHDTFMRRVLYSHHCTVAAYLVLLLVAGAGAASLVVVGTKVVQPYLQVMGLVAGTCTPLLTADDGDKTCVCGAGCTSRYRCLRITITFLDEQQRAHNATLYENESSLGKECSFYPPCKSSPIQTTAVVHHYRQLYGRVGTQPFPCFYRPQAPKTADHGSVDVIRERRFSLSHVVNGLLWSVVAMVTAVGLLGYACRRRGGCTFL